jgi:hypothetical protein
VQDAIAEFQRAPLWAQIAMVLFAAMVLSSFIGPSVRHRKFRRRFDAIARGLGLAPPSTKGWPVAVSLDVDGRAFNVTHDFRSTSRGGSYRGPTGYLLITGTQLASERWSMHQVDISMLGRVGSWLVSRKRLTGDADFDARFLVVEDGLPVRDGWLDAATRTAIAKFVDETPLPGVIWIRAGQLLFTMGDPWTAVDGPAIRALLQRQSILATALDRTSAARV